MSWFKKKGIIVSLFGEKDKERGIVDCIVDEKDIVVMAKFFGIPETQKEEIIKKLKEEGNETRELERKEILIKLDKGYNDIIIGREDLEKIKKIKKQEDELSKEIILIRIKLKTKYKRLLELAERLEINRGSELRSTIINHVLYQFKLDDRYMKERNDYYIKAVARLKKLFDEGHKK